MFFCFLVATIFTMCNTLNLTGQIKYVQNLLNERPRKTPDFKTPKVELKNYCCINNLNRPNKVAVPLKKL